MQRVRLQERPAKKLLYLRALPPRKGGLKDYTRMRHARVYGRPDTRVGPVQAVR